MNKPYLREIKFSAPYSMPTDVMFCLQQNFAQSLRNVSPAVFDASKRTHSSVIHSDLNHIVWEEAKDTSLPLPPTHDVTSLS